MVKTKIHRKIGKATLQQQYNEKVKRLSQEIAKKKQDIFNLNLKLSIKNKYISELHNFIGTQQLKKFKELLELKQESSSK